MLELNVGGYVEQRCSITSLPNDVVSFSPGEVSSFSFDVDCNAPFSLSLQSNHGGLKQTSISADRVPSGLAAFTTYLIDLSLPLTGSAVSPLTLNCSSRELSTGDGYCGSVSSGSNISINSRASVNLLPSESQNLVAGHYEDTLIIEVSLH